MATVHNRKLAASYPGKFGKRENRMIAANYSALVLVDESYSMDTSDGITHVNMSATAGTCTLILPSEEANEGRLVAVYVADTTAVAEIKESDGITDALAADNAAGGYLLFCTGSDWIQVG